MSQPTKPMSSEMTSKISVLIVDDIPETRENLRKLLYFEPDILIAGMADNGRKAIEEARRLQPDIVLMDLMMPVMDGLEALRRIRKGFPQIRVIMFSTLTQRGASATFEALALGADDYVTKASNVGSLDRSLGSLRAEHVHDHIAGAGHRQVEELADHQVAEGLPVRRRNGAVPQHHAPSVTLAHVRQRHQWPPPPGTTGGDGSERLSTARAGSPPGAEG
jgi:chemotaxis response regulator CheB